MDLPERDRIVDDDDDAKLITECLEEHEFVELPDVTEPRCDPSLTEPDDAPEELVAPELMFPNGVDEEDEN